MPELGGVEIAVLVVASVVILCAALWLACPRWNRRARGRGGVVEEEDGAERGGVLDVAHAPPVEMEDGAPRNTPTPESDNDTAARAAVAVERGERE